MFYWWNPYYLIFMAPALLFMLYAQWRVQSAYAKWGRVPNSRGLTGAQVAQHIVQHSGGPSIGSSDSLHGIGLRGISGQLTDNYDPRTNTLSLSQTTINSATVASMAVVAHELGHAEQDMQNYLPMRVRSGLVPLVNIGAQFGPILFIIGFLLNFTTLVWLGILLFSTAFVFALVTLPVELNASRRAMDLLAENNLIVDSQERRGARAVLNAAALTYVAGMLTALFQLLYYIMLAGSGRRRRD
jgi:Zn-dependent membrane protease YugP